MQRDIKFEVQFLLSLTLLVFGILSVPQISGQINNYVAYLLILALAMHLSTFNILYWFDHSLEFSLDFVESMKKISRPSLSAITILFVYLIGHIVASVAYNDVFLAWAITTAPRVIIIRYLAPGIVVIGMVLIFNRRVSDPVDDMDDINIKVIPDSVKIFPDSSHSDVLTIKIENNGEDLFPYDLRAEGPETISIETTMASPSSIYEDSGELQPGRASRWNLKLSHDEYERSTEVINVVITFDGARKEYEIMASIEM